MKAKKGKRTSTSSRPHGRAPLPDRLGRQLQAVHRIAASRRMTHLPMDVYSMRPEDIAEQCGVSVTTALRWKLGQSPIPYLAAAVLSGHVGAVSSDWHGWFIQGDALISPDGERISQAALVRAAREAAEHGYSSIAEYAEALTAQQERL